MSEQKRKLLVFAGKPGVGKSTIIKRLFPELHVVDVEPFVMEFQVNGFINEDKTLLGYQNMYAHITQIDQPIVVLEIGTNHPDFNVQSLHALTKTHDVRLFLCEASRETCTARANERGLLHSKEGFERRMARDFPNTFLNCLRDVPVPHVVINFEGPLEETAQKVKELALSGKTE